MNHTVDQVRAVIEGLDGYARRKRRLNLRHFFLDPLSDHPRILTPQHQRHRHHRLAFPVHTGRANAWHRPDGNGSQLTHTDRYSIRSSGDDDIGDVCGVLDQAFTTDEICLAAMFDVPAARDHVVFLQGLEHPADRQAIAHEFGRVDDDMVLLGIAAIRSYFDHARNRTQPIGDLPVENLPQLHGRVTRTSHGKHEDFPQTGCHWPEFRGTKTSGDLLLCLSQALGYHLAREINRYVIFEDDRHHRETKARHRTDLLQIRQPAHSGFHG